MNIERLPKLLGPRRTSNMHTANYVQSRPNTKHFLQRKKRVFLLLQVQTIFRQIRASMAFVSELFQKKQFSCVYLYVLWHEDPKGFPNYLENTHYVLVAQQNDGALGGNYYSILLR